MRRRLPGWLGPSNDRQSFSLRLITPKQEAEWKQGTLDDWAMETFNIAYDHVYGKPPLSKIRYGTSTGGHSSYADEVIE